MIAEKLFKSKRGEKRVMKAAIGVVSGVIIGALMFLIYRYNFDYTAAEAGILAAVLTFLFCLGLAMSSSVRCITALAVPNICTGTGRAILLSAIFSLILQHPVSNISYNAKETGKSMTCTLELAASQARILQRGLAAPLEDIHLYIKEQRQKLKQFTDKVNNASAVIRGAWKGVKDKADFIQQRLSQFQKNCKESIGQLSSDCEKKCNEIPAIFSGLTQNLCSRVCDSLQILNLQTICNSIQVDQSLVDVLDKISGAIEKALRFFEVDFKVSGGIEGETKLSKPAVSIKNQIENDIEEKVRVFRDIVSYFQKLLSASLVLIFLQSTWYLRNYLTNDGYDNIYITSQFTIMDQGNERNGREKILPLQKKEVNRYVDTTSFKLNRTEFGYATLGLIQVLFHMLLCIVIITFDYALFYILQLVKKYGDNELEIESRGGIEIEVQGSGLIAQFYQTLIEGFKTDHNINITVVIEPCLPNPKEPSAGMIPIFLVFYIVVFAVVILRAYGMRLRRIVSAYFCPEQELARLDYLHKKIRQERIGFLKFPGQPIQSTHQKGRFKQSTSNRFTSWLTYNIRILTRLLPQKTKLECTTCKQGETSFNDVQLTPCDGIRGEVRCEAVYCQECKPANHNECNTLRSVFGNSQNGGASTSSRFVWSTADR